MNQKKWKKQIALLLCVMALFFTGCTESSREQSNHNISGIEKDTEAVQQADIMQQEETNQQEMSSKPGTEVSNQTEGDLTVTFLDVGQGNAVLVQNDGLAMLIDGGDRDKSSYVVRYLKEQGIEKLAYVISSHYDADHLNGVIGAMNAFTCEEVLSADYETDTKVYDSFWNTVSEKEIPQIFPKIGENYEFGDAYFTIVCPDKYGYSEDNDNSIGIRLVYGENSFLILGDASSEMEQVMINSGENLASDVYLASHHGSDTASSAAFLEKVSPQAIVISCGEGNSYGHPAKETMERIQNTGASLYRTDLQGNIIVTSDGINLTWNVEPCQDYRSGDEIQGVTIKQNQNQEETQQEETYVLNQNTKKFHRPDCKSVSTIKEENKANFTGSRQELLDAGYSSCKSCNP